MIQPAMGFLGAGNMAEALIRRLLETRLCLPEKLWASDINEIRLAHMAKAYGIETRINNPELVKECSILILAVKPQQAAVVLAEIASVLDRNQHILLSLAAGLTTQHLEKMSGLPLKVVRIMPNTPAYLGAGATAFCLGQYADEGEALLARQIFEAVGIVARVEEKFMDAVTALSGSGPAYVFKLCEMMIAAGQEMGLEAQAARPLAIQTIFGAARMLKETGQSPEDLRKAVTSRGGTTEAALKVLESSDFVQVFISALKAAKNRGEVLTSSAQEKK